MITLDKLNEIGADTQKGLTLCMGKEDFYLQMVTRCLSDARFEDLMQHLADNDLDAAYKDAHALKGVLGNLALTPLFEPICEINNLLNEKKEADYISMYQKVMDLRNSLKAQA